MLHALVTVFEERYLDGDCGQRKMRWTPYIKLIHSGWNPEGLHEHWLDAYRKAVRILIRDGVKDPFWRYSS